MSKKNVQNFSSSTNPESYEKAYGEKGQYTTEAFDNLMRIGKLMNMKC